MSAPAIVPPVRSSQPAFRRFSVGEYHQMIETGILTDEDKVELIEGYVELKMPRNPAHDSTVQATTKRIFRVLPKDWDLRVQLAVTLTDSEPEPDAAVVRGDESAYRIHHPSPADVGMLAEVSDSSLDRDRIDKGRIYARARIPIYWIINLIDRQVEVYTDPSGPTAAPAYAKRQIFKVGDAVPVVLDSALVGSIPVAELMP
jgi:Uma2 family endonuclease